MVGRTHRKKVRRNYKEYAGYYKKLPSSHLLHGNFAKCPVKIQGILQKDQNFGVFAI